MVAYIFGPNNKEMEWEDHSLKEKFSTKPYLKNKLRHKVWLK
jgi:hypothetical protein